MSDTDGGDIPVSCIPPKLEGIVTLALSDPECYKYISVVIFVVLRIRFVFS